MYADVVKLREVKKGECFTLKNPSTVPDEEMPSKYVYVRGDYIRPLNKYEVYRYDDINRFSYFNGDRAVYINFTF